MLTEITVFRVVQEDTSWITLKTEAASPSKTLVTNFQSTQCQIPGDCNLEA
jgi:hypothetical protein